MTARFQLLIRSMSKIAPVVVWLAMLALSTSNPASPRQSVAFSSASRNDVTANDNAYYPVVRLRKMHLVRPDLIPYPIYFSIYC